MFTIVRRNVLGVGMLALPITSVKAAVERFALIYPDCPRISTDAEDRSRKLTLEAACLVRSLAGEGYLRDLALQHTQNLRIGHLAHLIILLNSEITLVTDSTFLDPVLILGHQRIAGIVSFAEIAVDTIPTLFAITGLLIRVSRLAVVAIWETSAQRFRAVIATEARRTGALAVEFVAGGELMALVREI